MIKRQPENERVKRRYVLYLKDAKGRDEASIDAAMAAIERFEDYNRRRDFKAFHIEQARFQSASCSCAQFQNRQAAVGLDGLLNAWRT